MPLEVIRIAGDGSFILMLLLCDYMYNVYGYREWLIRGFDTSYYCCEPSHALVDNLFYRLCLDGRHVHIYDHDHDPNFGDPGKMHGCQNLQKPLISDYV